MAALVACACFTLSVEISLRSVLCLVFVVLALYLFAAFLIRKCKKKYLQLYVHKYIGDVQADICLVCLSTLVENTDRTFSEREEEAQTPLQTNKVTKSQF